MTIRPQREVGSAEVRGYVVPRRLKPAVLWLGVFGLLFGAIVWLQVRRQPPDPIYQGKLLSHWFYGQRTNFLWHATREARAEAVKEIGTNALPFLLSSLRRRASLRDRTYFRVFPRLPRLLQERLPFPLSADDIQMVSLSALWELERLPSEWLAVLAEPIPRLASPQVRCYGLTSLQNLGERGGDCRAVIPLCRRLLQDEHPAIQFHAALILAEVQPSCATNCLPLLLAALRDEQWLRATILQSYHAYEQPRHLGDQVRPYRARVREAMRALEPYVDKAQQQVIRESLEAATKRDQESRTPGTIEPRIDP